MVKAHQVEKKVPLTILEEKINDKSMQFVVESDTGLDLCIQALDAMKAHVEQIMKDLEEKQAEEAKLAAEASTEE